MVEEKKKDKTTAEILNELEVYEEAQKECFTIAVMALKKIRERTTIKSALKQMTSLKECFTIEELNSIATTAITTIRDKLKKTLE